MGGGGGGGGGERERGEGEMGIVIKVGKTVIILWVMLPWQQTFRSLPG